MEVGAGVREAWPWLGCRGLDTLIDGYDLCCWIGQNQFELQLMVPREDEFPFSLALKGSFIALVLYCDLD